MAIQPSSAPHRHRQPTRQPRQQPGGQNNQQVAINRAEHPTPVTDS